MLLTIRIINVISPTRKIANVKVTIIASKTVTVSPPFGVLRVKNNPPFW